MDGWEIEAALQGYADRLEDMAGLQYGAARWNAAATAMSKEASRKISRHEFPWEKKHPKQKKRVDVESSLQSLAKAFR